MSTWRLLRGDRVDAARGLAVDEALMADHARGTEQRDPALRLYTYSDHAALCGRYQHLQSEIDIDACARSGISFNRRPTGGGAIVMGSGQLGVAVVTRAPTTQHPKGLLESLSSGIVAGLAKVGVDAEFAGKNDLKVDGRKIAGLGLYLDGQGGLLFHSSVLADLDIELMLDVLETPASKLGRAGVDAVGRRITTVTRETGEGWDGQRLREVIALGFSETLGIDLVESELTDDEEERTDELVTTKYATDTWRFQRSPGSDATASAVLRTPLGGLRLYLSMDRDIIKSALFTGDFNVIPDELGAFEAGLKWSRATHDEVSALAGTTLGDASVIGISAEEIVNAVIQAADAATDRALAAPERSGSCYFPETQGADR